MENSRGKAERKRGKEMNNLGDKDEKRQTDRHSDKEFKGRKGSLSRKSKVERGRGGKGRQAGWASPGWR